MAWVVLDAHDVDLAEIDAFCAAHATEVALMAEYVYDLHHSPHLRDYLLCVLDPGGNLVGLCWVGGNVVPVRIPPGAVGEVVAQARRRGRRYSSIVGTVEQVAAIRREVGGAFGPVREVRERQPHLEINAPPALAPDPRVRPSVAADFSHVFAASVAMFTEEVGYSPLASGGGYERRVRSLISAGRSLSWIEHTRRGREVIFKADLGTVGFGVTQVQGVWINPRHRGRGLAAPAMAAVVNYAHQNFAPTVSLYVNDFNAPALATYARVGFVRTATYTTVLY